MSKIKKNKVEGKRLRLSACMIAKNEEAVIARCIDSYKDIVDEIIVVDTGSIDRTKEIAIQLGAKVYDFKWEDDFSAAKNFALDKAIGDWVIFLDADEYFPGNMAKKIPIYIEKYMGAHRKLLLCKMINIDVDEDEVICDFVQGRIFKREAELKYVGKIHETLKSRSEEIQAVYLEENELVIHHTGYSREIRKDKAERNLELLLRELKNDENDAKLYQYIATSYSVLGDKEKSIEYLKKYLKSDFKIAGMHIQAYQILIGDMMKSDYSYEEVYEVIQEAISTFKNNPMPYVYLAQWYYVKKDYKNSLDTLIKAIQFNESYKGIEMNLLRDRMFQVYNLLAQVYLCMGDTPNAIESYIDSLKENKKNSSGLVGFLKATQSLSFQEIQKSLEKIYNKESKEDMIFLLENIVKVKRKDLLEFYVKLLDEKFNHQDYSRVFLYLLKGEYLLAFKHFWEAYEITEEEFYLYYAAITGFVSGNSAMLALINQSAFGTLKKILSILLGEKNIEKLTAEDAEGYMLFLNELLQVGSDAQVALFLELSEFFDETIKVEIKGKAKVKIEDKLENKSLDEFIGLQIQ